MPSRMQNPATASPELSGPNTADKPLMNTTAKETSRMLLIDMAKMRRAFVRGSVVAFTFAHSPWTSI